MREISDDEILSIVKSAPALESAEAEWLYVCRAVLALAAPGAAVPAAVPLKDYLPRITDELIDRCAQRLVSWEDGCVWPDSWSNEQVWRARKDAEKVLREACFGEQLTGRQVPLSPAPGDSNE